MGIPSFHDVALPGAIVPQLFPNAHLSVGGVTRALEIIAAEEFFGASLIPTVSDSRERAAVAELTAGAHIRPTYCLIPIMAEEGLSLSALDQAARARAVDSVRRLADEAREVGAPRIMVGSGPAPADAADRDTALAALRTSLEELAPVVNPDLTIVIEPLDVLIHKKQTLGYTSEAVQLVQAVAQMGDGMTLCLDTAHITLNEEDVDEAIASGEPYTSVLHFCNAIQVLDHPMYGDHHPPLGAPGYLDVPEIARIMAGAARVGLLAESRNTEVCLEQFNYDVDDWDAGIRIMRSGREALEQAWALAAAVPEV